MPSAPAKKDSSASDMAPFIIFMAFVILTTVIVLSIYRLRSEGGETFELDNPGFVITLDARDPVVFAEDFLTPGHHLASDDGQSFRPDIRQSIVEARRLIADGDYERAEDLLRTLFLFYPDDLESVYLLSQVLRATGRAEEAARYDEMISAPRAPAMPESQSNPDASEKRTGS